MRIFYSIKILVIFLIIISKIDSTLLCLLPRTNRFIDKDLASHLILSKRLHNELSIKYFLSMTIYRKTLIIPCLIHTWVLYTLLVRCNLMLLSLYTDILYWPWLVYWMTNLLIFMSVELVIEVNIFIEYILWTPLLFHLLLMLKVLVANVDVR